MESHVRSELEIRRHEDGAGACRATSRRVQDGVAGTLRVPFARASDCIKSVAWMCGTGSGTVPNDNHTRRRHTECACYKG